MLSLFYNAGVTFKLKKCDSFTETINYQGHVIRPRGLEFASHTTDAIRELQPPTSLTELRSFFGLCTVFRRFVPQFVRVAVPLKRQLRKVQPSTFEPLNEEEMAALIALKKALVSLSSLAVFALPNFTSHVTLDTHACAVRVGCVLLQKQSDDTI